MSIVSDVDAQLLTENPLRTWTSTNFQLGKFRFSGEDSIANKLILESSLGKRYEAKPDELSADDIAYLEGFSILPPTADPTTADYETYGLTDWNFGSPKMLEWNPILAFGIRKSLTSYHRMRALRMLKLRLDVFTSESERDQKWSELRTPPYYFPKMPVNEFEENRQHIQFVKEVKGLTPFRFAKEVFIAAHVQRGSYDFKRAGYPFQLPPLSLVRGDRELSHMAFLHVPPEEAEAFPKKISRFCLLTLRPLGILEGRFVFEPVKARIYHVSSSGLWVATEAFPEIDKMFSPAINIYSDKKEKDRVVIDTRYNKVFIQE